MADTPILDLTTEEVRPIVRIDNAPYQLRMPNDLTLEQFKAIQRVCARIFVLDSLETPTAAEAQEHGALLAEVSRIALEAPASVHERLGDMHRLQIFHVFTELSLPRLQQARANLEAGLSTGMKPSRGSSASTAAPRRRGSAKSRSASSART